MNNTKEEIIKRMHSEMPYRELGKNVVPYVYEAMDIYAKQEAFAFANWLSHADVSNKTVNQLYAKFKIETTESNSK